MVRSADTALWPATVGGLGYSPVALNTDTLPDPGYTTEVNGPLLADGPGILLTGDAAAVVTGALPLGPALPAGVKVRLKIKGLHSGRSYASGSEATAGTDPIATVRGGPQAIESGDPVALVVEQTAGALGQTIAGGSNATNWARQTWQAVNALRALTMQQVGDSYSVTATLQQPDVPELLLFCCVEKSVVRPTKRLSVIVPHGPHYYLECDPTIYDPIAGDGYTWSWSVPLCSCPPGQEQKLMIGRLGIAPEIIWHSRLYLMPPCPAPVGTAEVTDFGDCSETIVTGECQCIPALGSYPPRSIIFVPGDPTTSRHWTARLVGSMVFPATGVTPGTWEFAIASPTGPVGNEWSTFTVLGSPEILPFSAGATVNFDVSASGSGGPPWVQLRIGGTHRIQSGAVFGLVTVSSTFTCEVFAP